MSDKPLDLIKEGLCNWCDLFYLQAITPFLKPDVVIDGADGNFYKLYLKRGILQMGDSTGTVIYRAKYNVQNDRLELNFGSSMELNWYERGTRLPYTQHRIKEAFKNHVRSSVDEVLLG